MSNIEDDRYFDLTNIYWMSATKERGKIAPLGYKVLRQNRVKMVNGLDPEKLIPHLKYLRVIDEDDVGTITKKSKVNRKNGTESMLGILYNSGREAFERIIEALQRAGYNEMATELTEDLEKEKLNTYPVTDKERGRLSGMDFDILRDHQEILVRELNPIYLTDSLFQNNIIDEDDLERITKTKEELRMEGAEELLNIICNSGQNVFPGLVISLFEAGYFKLGLKLYSEKERKVLTEICSEFGYGVYPHRPFPFRPFPNRHKIILIQYLLLIAPFPNRPLLFGPFPKFMMADEID